MNKLVIDIDNTLCITTGGDYRNSKPIKTVIKKLNEYYDLHWYIILYTSRNMNSYSNNIGLITANTLPILIEWLKENQVKYHEIHLGKPWAQNGFYIDDKAIRPKEFITKDIDELKVLCDENLVLD